jgi:hypothetical protein
VLLPTSNLLALIAADEQLDHNGATADQPEVFSEIGNANSEKFIKSRPYPRENELVQKTILPPTASEQIKRAIVGGQE